MIIIKLKDLKVLISYILYQNIIVIEIFKKKKKRITKNKFFLFIYIILKKIYITRKIC